MISIIGKISRWIEDEYKRRFKADGENIMSTCSHKTAQR